MPMKKRNWLVWLGMGAYLLFSLLRLDQGRQQEGLRQLQERIRRTAVSCYALEGCYPPSLDYMKIWYGLEYNEEMYLVHYEAVASNLMPDITVMERMP